MKRILLLAAVLAAAVSLVGTTSAGAYGGKAEYQVGLSFSCDNKTSAFCAPDLFGLAASGAGTRSTPTTRTTHN